LNLAAPASWLPNTECALYHYFEKDTCVRPRECNIMDSLSLSLSLSGKEIHVANAIMWCALLEGMATKTAQAAQHFSRLLHVHRSGYVIFRLRDLIAKFKIHQI